MFVNTVVVTSKFGNIMSFVVNWCSLSCHCQGLSLRTCCCYCCCDNYAFERQAVFIVSLSSFLVAVGIQRLSIQMRRTFVHSLINGGTSSSSFPSFSSFFNWMLGTCHHLWRSVAQEKSEENKESNGLLMLVTTNCLNAQQLVSRQRPQYVCFMGQLWNLFCWVFVKTHIRNMVLYLMHNDVTYICPIFNVRVEISTSNYTGRLIQRGFRRTWY